MNTQASLSGTPQRQIDRYRVFMDPLTRAQTMASGASTGLRALVSTILNQERTAGHSPGVGHPRKASRCPCLSAVSVAPRVSWSGPATYGALSGTGQISLRGSRNSAGEREAFEERTVPCVDQRCSRQSSARSGASERPGADPAPRR